jgi:hypothetical protein
VTSRRRSRKDFSSYLRFNNVAMVENGTPDVTQNREFDTPSNLCPNSGTAAGQSWFSTASKD